jgi:hypothetical protein
MLIQPDSKLVMIGDSMHIGIDSNTIPADKRS